MLLILYIFVGIKQYTCTGLVYVPIPVAVRVNPYPTNVENRVSS